MARQAVHTELPGLGLGMGLGLGLGLGLGTFRRHCTVKNQFETFEKKKKKDLYHITFSTFENLLQMNHLLNHKLSAIGRVFWQRKQLGLKKPKSWSDIFYSVHAPLDTSKQHYFTLSTLKRWTLLLKRVNITCTLICFTFLFVLLFFFIDFLEIFK